MIDGARSEFERVARQLDVPFSFHERPTPVPGDMRVSWRTAVIILVLDHCRGQRSSLPQLHVLNWAVRSASTRELFLRVLSDQRSPDDAVVRVDPTLNQTIDIARAEGLVEWTASERIHLTDRGKALAQTIWSTADALTEVKSFLTRLPGKITQTQIDRLLDWKAG